MIESLKSEFSEVFKEELGVLKGIEAVSPLAAARMQHWALLLSAYHYNIECFREVRLQCRLYVTIVALPW